MKVLLLNPPSESGYLNRDLMSGLGVNMNAERNFAESLVTALKSDGRRMPVMTLGYLNGMLSADHETRVIDAGNMLAPAEAVLTEAERFRPDYVFAASSISQLPQEIRLLEGIKERTGARVGFVGESADSFSKIILSGNKIDFIIKGDPEIVAGQLVGSNSFAGLDNIIYREGSGIHEKGGIGAIIELDKLPFPNWDQFPIREYGYYPVLKKKPFITMQATRGCPYGCIYCPYTAFMGTKWRLRSVENVLAEIRMVREKHSIKSVLFRDPTFTLNQARTADLCNRMVSEGISLRWACETRLDCLTEELVDKMAGAGCVGINCGVESSDPGILRNVSRKEIPRQHMEKIIARCNSNGIRTTGFFIVGLPGETRETIRKTIETSLSLGLSYAEYKVATPFPGTELYNMAINKGWYEKISDMSEFPKFTSYNAYIKLDGISPKEVEEACAGAFKRFYSRRSFVLRELFRGNIINPFTIREALKCVGRRI